MPSFVKLLVGHFDTLAASAQLVVSVTGRQAPAIDAWATPHDYHVLALDLAKALGTVGAPNANVMS
jgi:hypothetical protein